MLKKEKLRRKRDFDRLFKKGRSVGGRHIVLFFVKNGLEYNRNAFLSSKKVGNSVQRNRARRLIRESFRVFEDSLKLGFDILFIARKTITETRAKEAAVEKDMKKLLMRSGLLS
jgi:ribonuclease P protein component